MAYKVTSCLDTARGFFMESQKQKSNENFKSFETHQQREAFKACLTENFW